MNPFEWALATAMAICNCGYRDAPDPYYIQIKDVQLAVPKVYVDAGSRIDIPSSRNEVRKLASTRPGIALNEFYMLLTSGDTKPWIQVPNSDATPDYLTIWLINPDSYPSGGLPGALSLRHLRADNRMLKLDEFGLIAHGDGFDFPHSFRHYQAQFNSDSKFLITCPGVDLPNPHCDATVSWQGLLLRYRFRHTYLAEWRAVHARVIDRLNSFINIHSKIQK